MSSLLGHLHDLAGPGYVGSDATGSITAWNPSPKISNEKAEHKILLFEDDPWKDSVLCRYRLDVARSLFDAQQTQGVLGEILRKPGASGLLIALRNILATPNSNEQISNELVEIVGYEDMDLIQEILHHRSTLLNEISDCMENKQSSVGENPLMSTSADSQLYSRECAQQRMKDRFDMNASRPMFSGIAAPEREVLPHVYSSTAMAQGNVVSQLGSKYMLPVGTTRHTHSEYEEVIIPPARPVPPMLNERLVPISELDKLVRSSFAGYTSLNRIQSIVFPTAYHSNENMLVCAPTGAGKTDVAMLTILRVIDQHRTRNQAEDHSIRSTIKKDAFKIIYVAPMKALASEIVRKLGKRLAWLSIEVQELTGDMQLTRAEISRTQIIVTTPEKWDVVTRKPTGEGEIASTLKLLIIDEVHLLNEERGAVIETIVARTLRQVETSQTMIRIVGLSATLPNYRDVGTFLCVSHQKGLFYFDSSFRPIPLEQHFLGIKGKPGSSQSRKNLDHVTFQKVSELIADGHQVMVFVHARKETVKTATSLRESAVLEGNLEQFSCEDHPQWSSFRQKVGESRNKEMKLLFDSGFGIHHAGMLRSDRNVMERMFEAKAIKVLCCTATLAWGVNLPAHAVIIKGTQVYDSAKGRFVDLSVLDVLQVFGRAGRPGMQASGEGYICTTDDKLAHYLDSVTSSIPIESQFQSGLVDALNAEISLGTVSNVHDAVQWLGYTYLFVRMRMNPFIYGISRESLEDDPHLGNKRQELILSAAQKLADCRMIVFDRMEANFSMTDLGKIAAKYYIRHNSVETFNAEFRPKMSEADVLAMLCMSTEFDQIQVRESEVKELEKLMERAPCDVKGGTDTNAGKVNILLQGFISREVVEDFALVSDMAYAAQNGGRIIRALLEIAISKKWANVSVVLMGLSKAVEKRLWPYEHPLKQFQLRADTIYALEQWADDLTPAQLAILDAPTVGKILHLNEHHGQAVVNAAKQFPGLRVAYELQPIASDVLRVGLEIDRAFQWNAKIHGTSEPFWLWVEDEESLQILQLSYAVFHQGTDRLKMSFFIPIPNGRPPSHFSIRSISDHWIGAGDKIDLQLHSLIMPVVSNQYTTSLILPFIPVSAFDGLATNSLSSSPLQSLNGTQSQSFWTLMKTTQHSLLCSPSGSGKTTLVQMALWATVMEAIDAWVLLIVPSKSAANELISDMLPMSQRTGVSLQHSSSVTALTRPRSRTIRVATADELFECLLGRDLRQVVMGLSLVVCENLEQLHPIYEMGISLLRLATQCTSTRYIGISSSLDSAIDVASWLDVSPSHMFNFRPQDRDQSLKFLHQTFSVLYSASLFKTMAKPAHTTIENSPPNSSVLIFVPSKEHCRGIALDLITYCTLQTETGRGYLGDGVSDIVFDDYCARLRDASLIDFVSKGIGFFHPKVHRDDRSLMLEMYAEGILRVLFVPRDACWSVPVRATVVIVMGTQYVHLENQGTSRQIRDYGLTELAKMQSRAVQQSGTGHFYLFCHAEALDTYSRFLENGLPLESELVESHALERLLVALPGNGSRKQQMVDILSFTFLSQRIVSNPSYYGFTGRDREANLSSVVDHIIRPTHED